MPIAVIRTGAAKRWSNAIRLIGPHTDTAATASPGLADRCCDTTESGDRLLTVERHPVRTNLGQFDGQLGRRADRVPGLAGSQIDDVGPVVVRKHCFADGRAVRRLASTDAGRDRRDHPVTDFLQVHHVRAVQDRQVNDQSCGAVQIVQQRSRGAVQPILVYGKRSEFD